MDTAQTQRLQKLIGDELVAKLGDGFISFTIVEITPAIERREMDVQVRLLKGMDHEDHVFNISLERFRSEVLSG